MKKKINFLKEIYFDWEIIFSWSNFLLMLHKYFAAGENLYLMFLYFAWEMFEVNAVPWIVNLACQTRDESG